MPVARAGRHRAIGDPDHARDPAGGGPPGAVPANPGLGPARRVRRITGPEKWLYRHLSPGPASPRRCTRYTARHPVASAIVITASPATSMAPAWCPSGHPAQCPAAEGGHAQARRASHPRLITQHPGGQLQPPHELCGADDQAEHGCRADSHPGQLGNGEGGQCGRVGPVGGGREGAGPGERGAAGCQALAGPPVPAGARPAVSEVPARLARAARIAVAQPVPRSAARRVPRLRGVRRP